MTPTTPATKIMDIVDEYGNAEHRQDDGQAVYFRNLIASEFDALTKERDELRLQIDIQAGSIEAVQSANQRLAKKRDEYKQRMQRLMRTQIETSKERDELAENHKECVRCLGEALQDTANLAVERDELMVALKFVESVYRQNCVAVGEPSSTLDYLQSVIAKAGVQ